MTPLRIGDFEVPRIGLGAMTLSQVDGYDEKRSIRTVHVALDAGVRLIDTADVYGPGGGYGINEQLVAKALHTYAGDRDQVMVATKGGHVRNPDNTFWVNGSRAHLHAACRASLTRLGLDVLPLYQHHRPDPRVPYAESMMALRELHDAGLVARVGISNADSAQIRVGHQILGAALVSVQNEYSPRHRGSEPEIDLCAELGLVFLSYSPLGGMREAKDLGARFDAFARVAEDRAVSPQRVALAWQLGRGAHVLPIPGASRPASVIDSVQALDLVLTSAERHLLDTV